MKKNSNDALHEEPRHHLGPVIPQKQEESLIEWLRSTGRLVSRGLDENYYEDPEEEELSGIMETSERYNLLLEQEQEQHLED